MPARTPSPARAAADAATIRTVDNTAAYANKGLSGQPVAAGTQPPMAARGSALRTTLSDTQPRPGGMPAAGAPVRPPAAGAPAAAAGGVLRRTLGGVGKALLVEGAAQGVDAIAPEAVRQNGAYRAVQDLAVPAAEGALVGRALGPVGAVVGGVTGMALGARRATPPPPVNLQGVVSDSDLAQLQTSMEAAVPASTPLPAPAKPANWVTALRGRYDQAKAAADAETPEQRTARLLGGSGGGGPTFTATEAATLGMTEEERQAVAQGVTPSPAAPAPTVVAPAAPGAPRATGVLSDPKAAYNIDVLGAKPAAALTLAERNQLAEGIPIVAASRQAATDAAKAQEATMQQNESALRVAARGLGAQATVTGETPAAMHNRNLANMGGRTNANSQAGSILRQAFADRKGDQDRTFAANERTLDRNAAVSTATAGAEAKRPSEKGTWSARADGRIFNTVTGELAPSTQEDASFKADPAYATMLAEETSLLKAINDGKAGRREHARFGKIQGEKARRAAELRAAPMIEELRRRVMASEKRDLKPEEIETIIARAGAAA
ncbi:MAG: hypothetical protein KJ579_12150 [Verrucomicrobia bacterium]|nr:hypothetical protein [Verrucomicrobiota bacterium]